MIQVFLYYFNRAYNERDSIIFLEEHALFNDSSCAQLRREHPYTHAALI